MADDTATTTEESSSPSSPEEAAAVAAIRKQQLLHEKARSFALGDPTAKWQQQRQAPTRIEQQAVVQAPPPATATAILEAPTTTNNNEDEDEATRRKRELHEQAKRYALDESTTKSNKTRAWKLKHDSKQAHKRRKQLKLEQRRATAAALKKVAKNQDDQTTQQQQQQQQTTTTKTVVMMMPQEVMAMPYNMQTTVQPMMNHHHHYIQNPPYPPRMIQYLGYPLNVVNPMERNPATMHHPGIQMHPSRIHPPYPIPQPQKQQHQQPVAAAAQRKKRPLPMSGTATRVANGINAATVTPANNSVRLEGARPRDREDTVMDDVATQESPSSPGNPPGEKPTQTKNEEGQKPAAATTATTATISDIEAPELASLRENPSIPAATTTTTTIDDRATAKSPTVATAAEVKVTLPTNSPTTTAAGITATAPPNGQNTLLQHRAAAMMQLTGAGMYRTGNHPPPPWHPHYPHSAIAMNHPTAATRKPPPPQAAAAAHFGGPIPVPVTVVTQTTTPAVPTTKKPRSKRRKLRTKAWDANFEQFLASVHDEKQDSSSNKQQPQQPTKRPAFRPTKAFLQENLLAIYKSKEAETAEDPKKQNSSSAATIATYVDNTFVDYDIETARRWIKKHWKASKLEDYFLQECNKRKQEETDAKAAKAARENQLEPTTDEKELKKRNRQNEKDAKAKAVEERKRRKEREAVLRATIDDYVEKALVPVWKKYTRKTPRNLKKAPPKMNVEDVRALAATIPGLTEVYFNPSGRAISYSKPTRTREAIRFDVYYSTGTVGTRLPHSVKPNELRDGVNGRIKKTDYFVRRDVSSLEVLRSIFIDPYTHGGKPPTVGTSNRARYDARYALQNERFRSAIHESIHHIIDHTGDPSPRQHFFRWGCTRFIEQLTNAVMTFQRIQGKLNQINVPNPPKAEGTDAINGSPAVAAADTATPTDTTKFIDMETGVLRALQTYIQKSPRLRERWELKEKTPDDTSTVLKTDHPDGNKNGKRNRSNDDDNGKVEEESSSSTKKRRNEEESSTNADSSSNNSGEDDDNDEEGDEQAYRRIMGWYP